MNKVSSAEESDKRAAGGEHYGCSEGVPAAAVDSSETSSAYFVSLAFYFRVSNSCFFLVI